MDIESFMQPSVFVIIILIIILIILYIFHVIQKKKHTPNECKCSDDNADTNQNATFNEKPNYVQRPISSENTGNSDNTIALYYANWCGYSRQFLPEWEKLKNKIKNNELQNVKAKEYECDENKEICSQNNIKGYPSLVLHKTNAPSVKYPDDKPRDLNTIVDWIKTHI